VKRSGAVLVRPRSAIMKGRPIHHLGMRECRLHVPGCRQADPPSLLGGARHRHSGAADARSRTALAGTDPGQRLRSLVRLYRASRSSHPALGVAVSALWLDAFRREGLEVQGVRLRLGYLRHERRLPPLRPPARGNGLSTLPTSLAQPAVGRTLPLCSRRIISSGTPC
jgi:hypothetical protein